MLYLKEISCTDTRAVYDLCQTIDADENGFRNTAKDLPYEQFPGWLKKKVDMGLGLGLEDWMVPSRTYWLYDGDTPVGQFNLRVRLTDALRELCRQEKMVAVDFVGRRYDTGNIRGFLEATVDFALDHPETGDWLRAFLKDKVRQL